MWPGFHGCIPGCRYAPAYAVMKLFVLISLILRRAMPPLNNNISWNRYQ